jgi:hypothetical protein
MEAASVTLPARREGVIAAFRSRRRIRRAQRLIADAARFERAADRLASSLEPDAWQVGHLRRQAAELRDLAVVEQAA